MKILIQSLIVSFIFLGQVHASLHFNWPTNRNEGKNHLLDDRQKILKRIWKHPYTQELHSTSYRRYEQFLANHNAHLEDAEGFYEFLKDLKYKKSFYDLIYLGIHDEDIIDLIFVIDEAKSKKEYKNHIEVLRKKVVDAALVNFEVNRNKIPEIELQLVLGNGLTNKKDVDRIHETQKKGQIINPRRLSNEGFSAYLLEILFHAPKEVQDMHIKKFIRNFAKNKELSLTQDVLPSTFKQFIEIIEIMELIPFNLDGSRDVMLRYNINQIMTNGEIDWQRMLKNLLAKDYFSYEVFEREISKVHDARSSRNLRRKLHQRETSTGLSKAFYWCQKHMLKKYTL